MLKRRFRLKNKKAFDATYKNRKIFSNSMLTLYLGKKKNDVDAPVRIGFVVSKKFHKRAVKRNRIRRLMREVCRLAIKNNELGILNDYMSFILIPKGEALESTYSKVRDSFFDILKKIK